MKPRIERIGTGSITIAGVQFQHDVIIRLNGVVEKRKQELSPLVKGASHRIALAEAQHIYEPGARWLIVGTGQAEFVELSPEAADFFRQQECQAQLLSTVKAIRAWNSAEGAVIGFFHVMC
ncbi:hypothetical protein TFLX_01257 [Thermoflexales bacterium]|nr:hypothetical protein TFLX_01257 [Thermoflexales bacterium]